MGVDPRENGRERTAPTAASSAYPDPCTDPVASRSPRVFRIPRECSEARSASPGVSSCILPHFVDDNRGQRIELRVLRKELE